MTTNTAKGIIDSLDSKTEAIDHKYHAGELHKHATNLVNHVHSGAPHTAEALMAFEHAYMIMKSLGVGTDVGPEEDVAPEPTPTVESAPVPVVEAATTNLQAIPEGHQYVAFREDQMSGMQGRNGIRQISSFVSSHATLEEAHAAASAWQLYPALIAEVTDRHELFVTPRIKITDS